MYNVGCVFAFSWLTILPYCKSIWFGVISCLETSTGSQWQEFALRKPDKDLNELMGRTLLVLGSFRQVTIQSVHCEYFYYISKCVYILCKYTYFVDSHHRYLRLELLEGVVAYHSGQVDKSMKVLTSAQEKFTQVIGKGNIMH